jgi:DHA1 family multidrug resistance protein-like MFS transporter
MAAIFRDSSAGQICRLFLGMQIAPYEDEKEGFALPQKPAKPSTAPSRDESRDDLADGSEIEKERSLDKDIENAAAGEGEAPPMAVQQHTGDANVVDWTGPTDEDNPQNWSTSKKFFVFGQICLLTFSGEVSFAPANMTQLTVCTSLQCFSHHYAS